MSGMTDVLVIVAVVGLVLARQFKPQLVADDKRWWVLPAVLVFLAVREPGLIDPGQQAWAVGLLAAEVLTGVAMGAAWAWSARVWTTPDGAVWSRGTRATAAVWLGGIAVRAGTYGLGVLAGIQQGRGGMLLALAATLLVRTGLLLRRARSATPSYRVSAVG
ncbi:DUF1453 domain-containing protein [Streptomyces sp. H27-D2]|uniref:DUF1453 domain-containing protein n=1 Tax=Streptomyces sp. H27-D2 TaxID=3046304 RepID=UPI002DBFB96F|nr:DUF1453 domain-containing protein [Streptomyces sp. H27-D2]MEC4015842.1 DUF1453 domain-containing protein [Streptomyces sp. H27-D2]